MGSTGTSKMIKVALGVAWLLSVIAVAAFVSGRALKNQVFAFGIELDKTQATLAFNHMVRYRELEHDLSKGCYAEALEKAKISKDEELMLLSSFFKEHPEPAFAKYVRDREPSLPGELKDFKSAYFDAQKQTWAWPRCK
jgi:hypothetical protein